MSVSSRSSGKAAGRVLALLGEAEGVLGGGDPALLTVAGAAAGQRRMKVDRATIAALIRADLLLAVDDPATPGRLRLSATAAGRARARRATPQGPDFRRQHGEVARRLVEADEPPVLADAAESPLAWLARRRGKDGRAYLTPARVAAGERLRADFTLARMMPTVTSNWSSGRITAGNGGRGGVQDLTDRALAARERVRAALDAVGRDLADVLLDVCCFLKGLETVESDRRWPARSAKVVLDIALGRLAGHYGLAEEARGPDRAARLRAWGSGDHRPSTGTALDRMPPPGAT